MITYVVDLVELAPELLQRQVVEFDREGVGHRGGSFCLRVVRSISQSPAAPAMQICTGRPGSSITSPVRRSRTRPPARGTSQVGCQVDGRVVFSISTHVALGG